MKSLHPSAYPIWFLGVILRAIIGSVTSIIILSQDNAFSTRCITFIIFVSIYVLFIRWATKRLRIRQSKSIQLGAFISGLINSILFSVLFSLTADYEDIFMQTLVCSYVVIASHTVMLLPEIQKLIEKKAK